MAVLRTLQIFFCSFTKLKFGQSFRDAKHAKTHERQRILHRVVFFTKSQKSENKNICVLHLTFELIKIQTCLIPQNDRLNLSFFEKYTCSWQKKWPEVILKRPFIIRKFWEIPFISLFFLGLTQQQPPPQQNRNVQQFSNGRAQQQTIQERQIQVQI